MLINSLTQIKNFAAVNCTGEAGFFGLPAWHRGLPKNNDVLSQSCDVQISDLTDFWQIAVNVIEMLTRIGAYVAVAMVIYGGFLFIISNGDPERINSARQTIIYALIGLALTITATLIVSYISGLI